MTDPKESARKLREAMANYGAVRDHAPMIGKEALAQTVLRELPALLDRYEELEKEARELDDLRVEWKQAHFESHARERKLRAALSSCWRVIRSKKLSDTEKMGHIDRIAREAAPPSILRSETPIPTKGEDDDR